MTNWNRAQELYSRSDGTILRLLDILPTHITNDPVAVTGILSSFNVGGDTPEIGVKFCRGLPAIAYIDNQKWELYQILYDTGEIYEKVRDLTGHAIAVFNTQNQDAWFGTHQLPLNNGIAIYHAIDDIRLQPMSDGMIARLEEVWNPRSMCRDYQSLLDQFRDELARLTRAKKDVHWQNIQRIHDQIATSIQKLYSEENRPSSTERPHSGDENTIAEFIATLPALMSVELSEDIGDSVIENLTKIMSVRSDIVDIPSLLRYLYNTHNIDKYQYAWLRSIVDQGSARQFPPSSHVASTSRSAQRLPPSSHVASTSRSAQQRSSYVRQSFPTSEYYEQPSVSTSASASASIGVNSSDAAIVEYIKTNFGKIIPPKIIQEIKKGRANEAYNRGIADILREIGFSL